jgi:hypothetical protein
MGTRRYCVMKIYKGILLQVGTFVLILSWSGKLSLKRYWAA